jgi:hypothetical protein
MHKHHLLNYKQAKARTIKVAGEIPREMYNFRILKY